MQLDTHKIRLTLVERGMTQRELADNSGISRQSVSTILARGTCSTVTAGKIAKGLGLEPNDVVKED